MINVSREPQNRSLLYVNEDLRIALILLRAQKSHYAMVSRCITPHSLYYEFNFMNFNTISKCKTGKWLLLTLDCYQFIKSESRFEFLQ